MEPEKIINALRETDRYIYYIFMRGGCYKFHLFLKTIFPDSEPYICQKKDHIITKIGDNFYDIRGKVSRQFELLYSPLTDRDKETVTAWSFHKNQLLLLSECPACDEPLMF